MDLLQKMLSSLPEHRPTAFQALNHEFFAKSTYTKMEDVNMVENMLIFQTEFQKKKKI